MSGLLSNAISGLQASQVALRTAGNNISNANVDGYSRQVATFSTRQEQLFGSAGYLGNGVNPDAVTRVVNEFINVQLRLDTSTFNQLDKFNTKISTVDKLLSDANTGLAGGLQSFFSALQGAASDPSSTPARQLVLTQADSLTSRFNTLYERLSESKKAANSEIATIAGQITAIAKNIANLNQTIASKDASSTGGGKPNDLLDQREEAIRKLSELASIQIIQQDGGDINVFIGNGEPLVVGPNISSITASSDGKVFIQGSNSSHDITEAVSGGQLGGLIKFKSEVVEPSLNELGRIAIVMSDLFNTAQTQGLDLNGHYGLPMFNDINDSSVIYSRVQHGDNVGPQDRLINLKIMDPSKITASDYDFSIAEGTKNYTVLRKSDGVVVQQGILTGSYPETIEFDGLALELESGSFQGGDQFTILPTQNAARDIKTLLEAPEQLAFAAPLRSSASVLNTGTASISAGQVLSIYGASGELLPAFSQEGDLNPPVLIRFTSATTYEVLDNSDPLNPVPLNPPMSEQIYYPDKINQIFSTDPGETKVVASGYKLGLPAGKLALPNVLIPTSIYANSSAQLNGYPVEQYTFSWTNSITGEAQSQSVVTQANASAVQTAAQLSLVPGVSARAYTTATITDINIDANGFAYPLQLSVNGINLIAYTNTTISNAVPNPNPTPTTNPNANEVEFNNYLVDRINSDPSLQGLGIRAESGSNPVTGRPEIRLVASSGVDLDIRFTASNQAALVGMGFVNPTESSISVNDSSGNPNVRLVAQDDNSGSVEQSAVTVGGRLEVILADGVVLTSQPQDSAILGDSTAANFAQSTYRGYQVSISGRPAAGDVFTLDFNKDAKNDNRNGLIMASYDVAGSVENKSLSLSQGYAKLVEHVGTKSNLSKINTEASKSVLEQTKSIRDGVSGVNLDEEAANLIQYQQLYSANARVINMAKDLFDTLLQSIG